MTPRLGAASEDNQLLGETCRRLVCPAHGSVLQLDCRVRPERGVPWPDASVLGCAQGCSFSSVGGIPRFVSADNYASAFGLQWRRYRTTQLDSYTGHPISRARLERCLGSDLGSLRDRTVLEVGSGAGRFTELLAEHCGALVSMDLSEAVEANLANCGKGRPYFLLQADIGRSPLPRRSFDVVFCLGVIQHTPSPEETMNRLAEHVKPGGTLVIDHYSDANGLWTSLGRIGTMQTPARALLKRLPPRFSLKAVIALVALCDPIRRRTAKARWLDRIVSRVLPTLSYYREFPEIDRDLIRRWNELDTYDALTDYYKHFRSPEDVARHLASLGFTGIHAVRGGNGVEARATAPGR